MVKLFLVPQFFLYKMKRKFGRKQGDILLPNAKRMNLKVSMSLISDVSWAWIYWEKKQGHQGTQC